MKPSSVLIALLLGISVYLLLQLSFGTHGIVARSVLLDYLVDAESALSDAQLQGAELQREIESLTSDPERIIIEARRIGMVGEREVIVRLDGYGRLPAYQYQPGSLPTDVPWPSDNRPLFRSIALAVTLFVLLIYLFKTPATQQLPKRRDDEWEIHVDER